MSSKFPPNVDRDDLLWSVLNDLVRKRSEGEVISDEEILKQHAELQPELEHFLTRASKIEAARGMTSNSEGVSQQLNVSLPRRFGNYQLEALIAHGGMGTVYRARQFGTDRPVAIKMIREQELANPDAVVRFLKESSTAAQLSHPNIVTVFEAGEQDGRYFYSMEYIDGETLAELISQAPLKGEAAVEILIPVAKAVAFANQKGLVHRDRFHLEGFGIKCDLDAHVVDDARRLDRVHRGYESVLAQIDHISAGVPDRFGLTSDRHREGSGMNGKALGALNRQAQFFLEVQRFPRRHSGGSGGYSCW